MLTTRRRKALDRQTNTNAFNTFKLSKRLMLGFTADVRRYQDMIFGKQAELPPLVAGSPKAANNRSTLFARWRQCARPSNAYFSFGPLNLPPQTAYRSSQPFFHSTCSLVVISTDRPTERQNDDATRAGTNRPLIRCNGNIYSPSNKMVAE